MNWQKYDRFLIGLAVGLVAPFIMFILYWMFFHHQISFPGRFLRYLMGGYLLSNVIKICTLVNLLIFYIGINKKMDMFSRGVILSVLLYIGLIAYVTYFHEPEYI
jgi:hypothetical protein